MNKVIFTYEDGRTREAGFYYDGVAKLVAEDAVRMRYAGLAHIKCIDGGKVVVDQPIK